MAFKKQKNIHIYTREKMEKMARNELNTTALRWGLMPNDLHADDDIITEIITQQVTQLLNMTGSEKEHIANPDAIKQLITDCPVKVDPIKAKATPQSKGKDEPEPEPEQQVSETDRVWVRFASGSSALEKADVFLSLNGDSCLVKRGEWVKLKKKYLPLLQDAIITQVDVGLDEEKTLRHVPRFNVSVRSLEQGIPKNTATTS